jgi:hypothetical protein
MSVAEGVRVVYSLVHILDWQRVCIQSHLDQVVLVVLRAYKVLMAPILLPSGIQPLVVVVVVEGTLVVVMVDQVEVVLVRLVVEDLRVARVYLDKAITGVVVQMVQVHTPPVGVVVQVPWVAMVYKMELLVMVVSVLNQVFRVHQPIMRVAVVVVHQHLLLYHRVVLQLVVSEADKTQWQMQPVEQMKPEVVAGEVVAVVVRVATES